MKFTPPAIKEQEIAAYRRVRESVEKAIQQSGRSPKEIAFAIQRHVSLISHVRHRGDIPPFRVPSIGLLARVLAACGYEIHFDIRPIAETPKS